MTNNRFAKVTDEFVSDNILTERWNFGPFCEDESICILFPLYGGTISSTFAVFWLLPVRSDPFSVVKESAITFCLCLLDLVRVVECDSSACNFLCQFHG